jgi:ADP-heptose:LPS heptosyltransferase
MGDMIILLPMLNTLRSTFPDAEIDIICEKRNMAVLHFMGLDSNSMAYDSSPVKLLRTLAHRKYDVAIDTEQFHHFSAVFSRLSGAPVRIGFSVNSRRNPIYTHLIDYDLTGPEGDQFIATLAPLGITETEQSLNGILGNTKFCDSIDNSSLLDALPKEKKLAVLHAGGSSIYKRWETDKYVETATRLSKEHDFHIVLVGNQEDLAISRTISDALASSDISHTTCTARCDLPLTAEIIKRSSLFVGMDSGLAHLATAIGIPSVALFGSTDPRKWGHRAEEHAVVQNDMPCSPCAMFGAHKPCRTIECMAKISADEVMRAATRVTGK